MGFGVDQVSNRLRRELLDRFHDRERVRRIITAVDQHHAVLGKNDRAIGIVNLFRVSKDTVFDLLEVRTELLRRQLSGKEQAESNHEIAESKLCFHTILLTSRIVQLPLTALYAASTLLGNRSLLAQLSYSGIFTSFLL